MDLDLNVLCVQLLPVHLNPKESMEKVDRMIDKYREADIVVLPEMAFSGYTFNDFEEIRPILEEPSQATSHSTGVLDKPVVSTPSSSAAIQRSVMD